MVKRGRFAFVQIENIGEVGRYQLMRYFLALVIAVATIVAGVMALSEKRIYVVAIVDGKKEIITSTPARKGLPLTIKFTHSVQKTPVVEELEYDGEHFILQRTIYQSQGVGLPFSESDGDFRAEGDKFIMDNMNRKIDKLELRTGVGTELCIELDGREFKLYEKFQPGTKIIVD